jgi:hypothetical protein
MDARLDLLATLRAELAFFDAGGYRCKPGDNWRPKFIFQDSPTCLNFTTTENRVPCSECVLMQLVPQEKRDRKIPCRYIPLNELGETIDSFYRSGTSEELERAFRQWLVLTIEHLERQAAGDRTHSVGGGA